MDWISDFGFVILDWFSLRSSFGSPPKMAVSIMQQITQIMQQITASPATFPLAGLEHHIEIFGSEGKSEM